MLRADAVTVIEDALRGGGALGQATCVAAFHAVVAVGTFSGVALVLLPRGIGADGQLSGWVCLVFCMTQMDINVQGGACLLLGREPREQRVHVITDRDRYPAAAIC